MGIIEKEGDHSGTLYCTMLYFDPDGTLGKHRKLKPTGMERLIWGEGDGSTLPVFDTPIGKIGGLICWENYMPLARTAMYAKGVQIYLAPTADDREVWQSTYATLRWKGDALSFPVISMLPKKCTPKIWPALKTWSRSQS